jgi:protein-S-isoprenylcysteine O-methyltransferase Ste14
MSAVALAVYVLGLVLAFGARTWLHWRSTGSTGFRGITGRPGSLPCWGGVLFPVAVLLGLLGPLLVLADVAPLASALDRPAVAVGGLAVALAGLALVLLAQSGMGASWRIGVDPAERTALVTDGVFDWARNPIFTGLIAVSIGTGLVVPTLITATAVACMIVAVHIQVRVVEEPYLLRTHGAAYVDYTTRVGRFLPGVGRGLPRADRGAAANPS